MSIRVITILFFVFSIALSVAAEINTEKYGIEFPKTKFIASESATQSASYSYPVMHPSAGELKEWYAEYLSQVPAESLSASATITSDGEQEVSLLNYLEYIPNERDQEQCGNCWVWASTGAIEITHSIHNNIYDRLSVQYFNSRYNNGGKSPFNPASFACNGGTPIKFSDFYNAIGKYGGNKMVIPWSNKNAEFKDGNATQQTSVNADTIVTDPHYSMNHMTTKRIVTLDNPQSMAISNIKNMIDNGKAVYLGIYLPDQGAWNAFNEFWATGDEEISYFQMDQFAGRSYSTGGGGHGVLVTGYKDDGTEGYWQCLNSYGTTTGRPNGLFYINMYMDYSASYLLGTNTYPITWWYTIDVTYTGEEPEPDPVDPIVLISDFSVSPSIGYPPLTVHFTDLSEGDPNSWKWDFGDGAGSAMRNPNHTYAQPGEFTVSLTVGKSGYTGLSTQKDAVKVKIPYVKISPFKNDDGGFYPLPTDPDGDGRFEDIDGNGWLEFNDPLVLLKNMEYAMTNEPVLQFDFDRSGFIGYGDVVALQKMV
jgi:PKD repeat protein